MKRKKKVKEFVKDHKKVLLAGVITTAGIGAGCVYAVMNRGGIKMPGFTIEGPLTIGDIGKLGEEYMKHDPDLTKETKILEVGRFIFE